MEQKKLLSKLIDEKNRIQKMGGEKALARQRSKNKLDVRERINRLFDPSSFVEIGEHVDHCVRDKALEKRKLAADGIITGWGEINGSLAYTIAYDFTVLGGSMGYHGEKKAARIREMAKQNPGHLVWIIDSAGARVSELGGSFFSTMGDLFNEQVALSGIVNQLCLVLGPGVAGTAYIPGLADCVIMSRKNSFLALAGPPLVEAAISEKISEYDLGGPEIHNLYSGLCHFVSDDDTQAIEIARKYLSFFNNTKPEDYKNSVYFTQNKISEADLEKKDVSSLNTFLPDGSHTPFDMKVVVESIIDKDTGLEFQKDFGQSLICMLGRIGGFSVGIIANQSNYFGGILTNDASCKAARFIQVCDMNLIPLVFLHDVPGFMVGSQVEKQGIIKDGAKFLFAMANSRSPKISVVIRKSYGAGYFVMCGRGFKPDLIGAWPTAEIALMGADGAVNILHRREIENHPEPEKYRAQLEEKIKNEISSFQAAKYFGVDNIIEPSQTRNFIIDGLILTRNKVINLKNDRRYIFPV